MKVDLKKLQETLTNEQVIVVMAALGATGYIIKDTHIIFPTICHNIEEEGASMKLYYYMANQRFHCYTQCGDTFNIFELVKRVFQLRNYNNGNFSFKDILNFILTHAKITDDAAAQVVPNDSKYKSILDRYDKKELITDIPIYNDSILNLFSHIYPQEWLDEGISKATMDKYNIRFSISQNRIVIPHYNINNQIIGIRGRALNSIDVELYGKYAPVMVEQKIYSHPLSQNLYGLNLNKEDIEKTRTVILYEGEKSVLLHNEYFPINNSVAVCGSNFNKIQLHLLLDNINLSEIVIAFDKEYEQIGTPQADKYFKKLWAICKKYQHYCNISFIFDDKGLLNLKDSPIDKGKNIFLALFHNRIKPWEEYNEIYM